MPLIYIYSMRFLALWSSRVTWEIETLFLNIVTSVGCIHICAGLGLSHGCDLELVHLVDVMVFQERVCILHISHLLPQGSSVAYTIMHVLLFSVTHFYVDTYVPFFKISIFCLRTQWSLELVWTRAKKNAQHTLIVGRY